MEWDGDGEMEFDYDDDDMASMLGGSPMDYNDEDMRMLQELYNQDPKAFQQMYKEISKSPFVLPERDKLVPRHYLYAQQLFECVGPSLQSVGDSIVPVLALCLAANLCKYLLLLYLPEGSREQNVDGDKANTRLQSYIQRSIHVLSALFGLCLVYYSFSYGSIYLILLSMVLYLVMYMFNKSGCGMLISVICLIYLILGEFATSKQDEGWQHLWHQMRGVQMLLCMRVISLAYDMQKVTVKEVPGITEYFGYIFCVATVIYGPWISFPAYVQAMGTAKISYNWLKHLCINSVYAIICLLVSNCVTLFFTQFVSDKWALAYLDAQSFRFSHYFICYLSQVTTTAAGIPISHEGDDDIWHARVTRPYSIELPRSLVEVVINWNIPMHNWLKVYVFKPTRSACGVAVALFTTYAASALLHGISFQLAAVLLSLAWYTAVEYYLRNVLSTAFSACLSARTCPKDCTHRHKESGTLWVAWLNYIFTAVSIYHLAYLGVMFNSDTEQETGYSMAHTLKKWKKLDFASHQIVFYLTILCLSIMTVRKIT